MNLIEESRKCNGCLCWLKYCKASCCRSFYVRCPGLGRSIHTGMLISIRVGLSPDLIKYYDLHGCRYVHGSLVFVANEFEVVNKDEVRIFMRCSGLSDDNLCNFHNTVNQPIICGIPNIDEYHNLKGVTVTPDCLYRFKLEDEGHGLDS